MTLQIPKWADRMASGKERLAVGVVVERRAIDHPWRKWRWRAVEVVPGLPGGEDWRLLVQGDGWARFAVAGVGLNLTSQGNEDYKYALAADRRSSTWCCAPTTGRSRCRSGRCW